MPYAELRLLGSDGLDLFAREWWPDGEPRAVLCVIHGLGEHSGRYEHVAAALVAAGHAVLAPDLRGHGRSKGPRGHTPSYEALLADLGRLLEEAGRRHPGRPRFLYGHSLGGNLVLSYALRRRPDLAGVVATGPLLRPAFAPAAWKLIVGRLADRVVPALSLPTGLDPTGLSRDPEVVRAYVADPLVHDRCSARMHAGFSAAGARAIAHAAEFPVPLLLLHGGADRITSLPASREFAGRDPGTCTFEVWDALYHELHNEPERAEVLARIVRWLDERLGERT